MKKRTGGRKLNIVPSAGYVLIEPYEAESKTAGGIYLPESATGEKPQKGTVIAVGADEVMESGKKKAAPCMKKDIVVYKKWGGNEYKQDGKEYLFVKFEDILATIR
jgi:chaperonin GroES